MFIPGETIAHQFYLPFVRSDISRVYVTYHQDDRIILKKYVTATQLVPEERRSYFNMDLTQEESLLFQNDKLYTIQLNVVFANGARAASTEIKGINGMQHIQEVVTSYG